MRLIGYGMLCLLVVLGVVSFYRGEFRKTAATAGVSGRVLDRKTGQPIPHAVVISVWESATMSGRFCFDTDTAVADSSGRYSLPGWEHTSRNVTAMPDKTLSLKAYAPGYVGEPFGPGISEVNASHQDLYLYRSESPRLREGYLNGVFGDHGVCRAAFNGENAVHEDHFQTFTAPMRVELEELRKSLPDTEIRGPSRVIIRRPSAGQYPANGPSS